MDEYGRHKIVEEISKLGEQNHFFVEIIWIISKGCSGVILCELSNITELKWQMDGQMWTYIVKDITN